MASRRRQGIAIGPAWKLADQGQAPPHRESQGAEVERGRLDEALAAARVAIEQDRDTVAGRGAAKEAEIFTAHLALLDDDALVGRARTLIDSGDSAEAAWHAAGEETAAQWRSLGDKLLSERAADVDDVGRRVLAALGGGDDGAGLQEPGIVVADELTPRDTAALDPRAGPGRGDRPRGPQPPTRRSSHARSGSRRWSGSAARCWRSPRERRCCSMARREPCSSRPTTRRSTPRAREPRRRTSAGK